ncbi:MAG: S9 family peptidase [Flavobacteriaceae bacterium]|nr:S9 family peptidase [Flavobacteriaceae bacterium]
MRKYVLLALFVWLSQISYSQKILSIEEAVLKRQTTLTPDRLSQLQWLSDGKHYSYLAKRADKKEVLVRREIGKSEVDTLLHVDTLNRIYSDFFKIKPFNRYPFYTWTTGNQFRFFYGGKYYLLNVVAKTIELPNLYEDIKPGASGFDLSDDGIAYINGNNQRDTLTISRRNLKGEIITLRMLSGKGGLVFGKSAHRDEFGISKGTFWSPNGNYCAFYRMDESMVSTYPIVGLGKQPSQAENIRYPMAGDRSHEVTVGIYDANTDDKIWYIKTIGDPEQYLTNIAWSPDEKSIYIAIVNRAQNHVWLNQYDVATGNFVKTLFEESDEKYTEPLHHMLFVKNNPNHFIWQSERDGYNHLYLYNADGSLIRQLTRGNWVVTDVLGMDAKYIYFASTKQSPIERHIYKVALAGGEPIKLTKEIGTHTALFNVEMTRFVDTWSSTDVPRMIQIVDNNGKQLETLLKAENPLRDYALNTKPNLFTIKAADGVTDLWCREIRPANFDPQKKYPVLVYLYNGPHVQLVNNTWLGAADIWFYAFANQGYIVFTVDGRGSENRGDAFEKAIFRNLGKEEVADQLKGVEWLKSQPYVDANRMAVHGWSFGGWMTTSLMCKHPDVFKVGVCGGPVIDWGMYEIMYTERYMDTPEENPGGYKEGNLLNYANGLKGKLLMIHGTSDPTVLWEHSLKFVKACVDNGNTNLDYFVYPEHEHNVQGPDRAHLIKKVTEYINGNL